MIAAIIAWHAGNISLSETVGNRCPEYFAQEILIGIFCSENFVQNILLQNILSQNIFVQGCYVQNILSRTFWRDTSYTCSNIVRYFVGTL